MNDQAIKPLADQMSVCAALVDLLIDKGLVSQGEFFERFERARAAGRSRSAQPDRLDGQTVLLVEAHADLARELQTALEDAGAEVLVARNAGEALARMAEFEFSAAVLDWRPTREHRTATRWLKEDGIPVLFHAAHPSEDAIAECGGPMLARPAPAEEIVRALVQLTGSGGGVTA